MHARGNDLQGQIRGILNTLHHPPEKSVLDAGTGENADFSHFFFFIVCLNFKTAKFNSMDVSVSLICKSSSKLVGIILYGLINSFCFNAVNLSNIEIQQDLLISDFNDTILQILKFHDVDNIGSSFS